MGNSKSSILGQSAFLNETSHNYQKKPFYESYTEKSLKLLNLSLEGPSFYSSPFTSKKSLKARIAKSLRVLFL